HRPFLSLHTNLSIRLKTALEKKPCEGQKKFLTLGLRHEYALRLRLRLRLRPGSLFFKSK
ncbi:MAG: hypothetical protein ACK5O1_05285, partial [Holosporales bacterium]